MSIPQLLRKDPAKRLSLDDVSNHPWILMHTKKPAAASATGGTVKPTGASS